MNGLRIYCLAFLVGILGSACSKEPKPDERYEVAVAGVGDVRDLVQAVGTLKAPGATEIRASTRGVVEAVLVKEGDTVRAGQVLARLHDPTRAPKLAQSRARHEADRSAMREARARLDTAREKLDRMSKLHAGGFVSPAAVASAQSEVGAANASLDRAVNETRASSEAIRVAEAEGSSSDIIAPLDGVVTLVSIQSGQTVTPEDKIPHFQTIQSTKELTLEVLIAEPDVEKINEKSQIYFEVEAYPNVQESANFVSLGRAPIRDGNFTSYILTAKYENPFEIMRPGMTTSVRIFQANSRSVLRIPTQAIHFKPHDFMPPISEKDLEMLKREYHGNMKHVRDGATGIEARYFIETGRRAVFILENGKPARREIMPGAMTDEFAEVLSGIKEGETVIVQDNMDPRRVL